MQTATASKLSPTLVRPVNAYDAQRTLVTSRPVASIISAATRVTLGHSSSCECVKCGFRSSVADSGLFNSFRTRASSRKFSTFAMAEESVVEDAAIEVEEVSEVAPQAAPAAPVSAFDAVIEVGGTQQLVSEGRFYSCNSLKVEPGTTIAFERVLAVKDGENLKIGQPYVSGAKVMATVMENYKGKKEIVYKMKPKKHTRTKKGHRQHLTKFLVTSVTP